MFSYESLSGRSNLEAVSINDLFDDVKLTNDCAELQEQGYIPLATENAWLKLVYMVKPTQAVIDHMVKSGRGKPCSAEIGLKNDIAFCALWESESIRYTTAPRIAGVVKGTELAKFKKNAELVGHCIVTKAYKKLYKVHPNFPLRSVREPVGIQLAEIQRYAKLVWTAVGYALRNKRFIELAEQGKFDSFYLEQDKLDFLSDKFGIKVPAVAKEKVVIGISLSEAEPRPLARTLH